MALPGLIVDVEARIDRLERGLRDANRAQARGARDMQRRADRSARDLERTYGRAGQSIAATFAKIGPGLLAGLSVAGIGAAAGRVRSLTREVALIGDEAARAGLSVEQFQSLKFVSEQSRIDVGGMIDAIKELNLRSDEFIETSGGPAADALRRLGFSAEEVSRKLKDAPELLAEIADRTADLDSAARLRIFDEILGGTGAEQLSGLLSNGGDELRRLGQEARASGAILDAELIEKAQELDRRFAALTTRLSTFGKTLAVNVADVSVKIATLRTDLEDLTGTVARAEALLGEGTTATLTVDQSALDGSADTIAKIVTEYHRLGEAADQLTGPLYQAAAQLAAMGENDAAAELNRVAGEMRDLVGGLNDGSVGADEFEARIQALAEAANVALGEVAAIDGVSFGAVTSALSGFVRMMGAAISRARELRATLPGANPGGTAAPDPDADDPRGNQLSPPQPPAPPSALAPGASSRPTPAPFEVALPDLPAASGGGGGGGGSGAGSSGGAARQSDYQREIEAIAAETAELQLLAAELARVTGARAGQADVMELVRTRSELLAAAQRSGMELTPQLRARIDELADGYVRAGDAADLAADKIREVQEASRAGANRVGSIFEHLATGAINAKEAVGQLILEIIKLTIRKRMMAIAENGGKIAQVFTMIGGGFADGGYTGDGAKLEPAGIVHRGEYVFSKDATNKIGVSQLERLHSIAKRGYSEGGLVTQIASDDPSAGFSRAPSANMGSTDQASITINSPITVNGSAGTPQQNADLAKRTAREVEATMRGVVRSEIQRQLRPGNALNRGGR